MKIKLTVCYDGTNYCGWQIQPNGISVQQVLEETLFKITGENAKITGSGRTDAGVHAQGQVASFETASTVPPEKFAKAFNSLLPNDIRVLESCQVDDDFDARKSAKYKTYSYSVYFGETENPLIDRYSVYLPEKPDLKLMKQCAELFIGNHDFKCFNASGSSAKTTVRRIYLIEFILTPNGFKIEITGNGFLYNMVRTMVGTMLKFAYKKTDESHIKKMLETGDKRICGKTMPAKGLCLQYVHY